MIQFLRFYRLCIFRILNLLFEFPFENEYNSCKNNSLQNTMKIPSSNIYTLIKCYCNLYFWWSKVIEKRAFVRPIKTIGVSLSATLGEICFLTKGLYVISVIVFSSTYDDVLLAVSKLSTSKFHLCYKNTTECIWDRTMEDSSWCQIIVNAAIISNTRIQIMPIYSTMYIQLKLPI